MSVTPEGPQPAPDWILGDDGHWKMPPILVGQGSAARPAPPATSAPPAGPGGPAAPGPAGASAAPGGPGAPMAAQPPYAAMPAGANPYGTAFPPPPQKAGMSAGKILALVGGVGALGIAMVFTLLVGVTFLGTTAEPELEPVAGGNGATNGPVASDPTPVGGDLDLMDLTLTIGNQIEGDGWETDVIGRDPLEVRGCTPPGWYDGAEEGLVSDVSWARPGEEGAITMLLVRYDSVGTANVERVRAQSQPAIDCARESALIEFPGSTATVGLAPDDPAAPGVGWRIDLAVGANQIQLITYNVFVGQMRATFVVCSCGDPSMMEKDAVPREAAAVLAEAQGLPIPGG